jgi:hypothetical protein
MRTFLEQFNEREPPDRRQTLDQLLDWTTVDSDGVTSDPAQWSDWERAVASVLATEIT